MIELRGVCCRYGDHEALSAVDLRVARGESVAILGPNGSGKSTLLKLLSGILCADSGTYRFDGMEISRGAMKDPSFAKRFHRRVGLLFQRSDVQLFCPVVDEEIAFGPRQMGMQGEEVEARVLDCLRLLDIEGLRFRVPYHLSEGEKRKVALASVLALNPEVLALDEPMGDLDARTRRFIGRIIRSLNAAGKTIVCATHDFACVEGLFQRAVVLSEGHGIARDDPYQAVIADTSFLRAYNIL